MKKKQDDDGDEFKRWAKLPRSERKKIAEELKVSLKTFDTWIKFLKE